MQRIYISDVNNNPVVCFNTGLDPRSFARTKMSQSLIELGYIVNPDGSYETWKPAEVNDVNGIMNVQGPLFNGKRLDLLINQSNAASFDASSQAALQAIVVWIKAKMFLGDKKSSLNPGASFVCFEKGKYPPGSVFFAPESISSRCLYLEAVRPDKESPDRYNCSDLTGLNNTAFCAGVMLYTLFTGNHPYPSEDTNQNMRDGTFLPINYAVPNLDEKLSNLIKLALSLPIEKKDVSMSAADIISNILKILIDNNNKIVSISSLFQPISEEKKAKIEKEKKSYLFKQKYLVKSKRFVIQNRKVLTGVSIALLFFIFIMFSMANTISQRPSTKGMQADSVVYGYYSAFSALDHMFMEACLQGADKTDLNAAINLTAFIKTRQAFDMTTPNVIPAGIWKENGGELPHPNVFGITNLKLEYVSGSENDNTVVFHVDYVLWPLNEEFSLNRNDILTLKRDRSNNWKITEILRTER